MDDNALSAMGRCGSYKMSAFGSNDLCSLSTQINRGLVCSDIATVTLQNRNKHSPVGRLAQKSDLWLLATGGVRARNRPRRRFLSATMQICSQRTCGELFLLCNARSTCISLVWNMCGSPGCSQRRYVAAASIFISFLPSKSTAPSHFKFTWWEAKRHHLWIQLHLPMKSGCG